MLFYTILVLLHLLVLCINGGNNNENIDIVQINTWHQALVSSLFKRKLNKLRDDAGLQKLELYILYTF